LSISNLHAHDVILIPITVRYLILVVERRRRRRRRRKSGEKKSNKNRKRDVFPFFPFFLTEKKRR